MSDPYAAFSKPVEQDNADPYAGFSKPVASSARPTSKIIDLGDKGPPTSRPYREAVAALPIGQKYRDYQGNVRENRAGPRMLTDPRAGNPIVPVGGASDAGRGYLRGLGEGVQGILDPDNMVSILGGFVGAKPKADNQFSALDMIQSAAYGGRALGRQIAGDQSGAARDVASARANTGQGRNLPQGGGYVPQTGLGRTGQVAGMMTPNALSPGSAVARAANVILPTAGTMAGGEIGQAVGGDTGRAVGEVVGGVAGGVAAGLRTAPARPRAATTPQARLQAEGIELTPGRLSGGDLARGVEDKLTSVPFLGDSIRNAQRRSFEGFNRALANRVLEPLGETLPDNIPQGRETVAYLQQRLGDEYDNILGRVTVQRDPQIDAEIMQVMQEAQVLPDGAQGQLQRVIDQIVNRRLTPGQPLTGDEFKLVQSEVGGLASQYSGSAVASEQQLGGYLRRIDDALLDLVRRTNPNEAPAIQAVDRGYSNLTVIERAAAKTPDGTITPAQARRAMLQADQSVRKRASAAGRGRMQDLIGDAEAVLPSTVPDSGTAGRLSTLGLFGGSGALASMTSNPLLLVPAAAAGVGMGAYSRPGIRAMNALSQMQAPAITYAPQNALVPAMSGAQQIQQQQRLPR